MASCRSVLILLALALALALVPATAAASPSHLVVKYRPAVTACVHCLVAQRQSLAAATGTSTLDALHAELGVRSARPLFFDRHARGGRSGAASYATMIADVERRFPTRSARRRTAPPPPDLSNVYVLEVADDLDLEAAAARYAADPSVEYAVPDREIALSFVPDDPYLGSSGSWGQAYGDLWGINLTRAPEAWDVARGAGTVVAIVDTGFHFAHPDLAANVWTNPGEIADNDLDDDGNGFVDDVRGWDTHDGDDDPTDEHGHGTHVAGTVSAIGDNGIGVVGMAWDARVMAVRAFGPQGTGIASNIAWGVVYAALSGADVINNSWGSYGGEPLIADAVATARGLGAVVVAAAGNGGTSVDVFEPANLDGVIAVAATDHQDAKASFSNFGEAVSVAAPGVDVLSLRAPAWTGPNVVGTDYLHISGTSMATPHVAGLAAVLLSAFPGLSEDEVRWHLELNAEQPGHPGWEGLPWNPYFGYGRIDAARVFDPPPVTTRLRPRAIERHVFAGEVLAGAETVRIDFTSLAPVSWTAAGPPWLKPVPTSGSGAADVALDLDGSTLAAGASYTDGITVSAPSAADGGATLSLTAHAHLDLRVGSEILVHADTYGGLAQIRGPSVASNGRESIVVWHTNVATEPLYASIIDENGTASAPIVVFANTRTNGNLAVGSDGSDFLVVWVEDPGTSPRRTVRLLARRVARTGALLDAQPIEIAFKELKSNSFFYAPRVAFDGQTYRVGYEWRTVRNGYRSRYEIVPVAPDGTLGKSRRVKPRMPRGPKPRVAWVDSPHLGCRTGECLFAWAQLEETAANTHELNVYGVPIVAGKPQYQRSARLLSDGSLVDLAAGPNGYFALAQRAIVCTGGLGPISNCAIDVVGARVSADGQPLDVAGIRLNRDPALLGTDRHPMAAVSDGTDWVAAFATARAPRLPGDGTSVFYARVSTAGAVLGGEVEGYLVRGGTTALWVQIAAAEDHVLFVWRDKRLATYHGQTSAFASLYGQRVATQAP
jgi:subtilisin family serine protease